MCHEFVVTGTHLGDLPNLPATGRSVSVRGAAIEEVREGKISRHSDYYDMAAFLRQLGQLPSPPKP